MKLYYSKGACSLACRILIHELQIPAEFEAVDLKTKKTEKGADFLAINPKGAVPCLMLDNGTILTENAIIHQYLADTYQKNELLPAVGNFKRYQILEWLNFVTTDLHKGFSPIFNGQVPQALKDEIFFPILKKKLEIVEQQLAKSTYLAADHFALPDGYLFVILRWAKHMKIDFSEWINLPRYYTTLKSHASIAQSLKEEGLEA